MKQFIDKKNNILFVRFNEDKTTHSQEFVTEHGQEFVIDFNQNNSIVAIEIFDYKEEKSE